VACLIGVAGQAFAQEVTATLLGQVTDAQGSIIQGAKITVTNVDRRMIVRTLASDANGEFVATLLPIGQYSVKVTSPGFKELNQTGIVLHAGDKVTLALMLQVGAITEQVTVRADRVQVQLQSMSSEGLLTGQEIRELSLNTRNPLGLLNTLPGVTNTSSSDETSVGSASPANLGGTSLTYSMNGGRTTGNNYLLDGADDIDRGANNSLVNTPSVDAVSEFKAIMGVYSAEFGRNASSQINVITRSGESDFHASAYEFLRNDAIAANNALNKLSSIARPPLRYNDFGFTGGGPVFIPNHYNQARNKTFFFYSQEFYRIIEYITNTGYAPTAGMKSGTFQHPVCVSYTTSAATSCATTSTQITNIDPVAAEYIKDVFNKLPVGDPNNAYALVSAGRSIFDLGKVFARIDHNLTNKHSLTFRYMHDTNAENDPYGYQVGAVIPYVATTITQMPGTNVMGRLTSVLSPSLLNEVAFAFTGGAKLSTPTGYLGKSNSPDVKVNLPFTSTLGNVPYLGFSGLSGLKGYGPYINYTRNYNFFDNITKTIGRHTLGAGFTYNYYQKTENNASTNAGSFSFGSTALPAGGATNPEQTWANFLLGNYATFTQTSLDLTPDMRQNEAEAYIQDSFRWTRNLTVNAGVRYSMFRVPYDDRNMLSNFDPNVFVKANAPTLNSAGTAIVVGTGNPLNGLIVNSGATVTGTTSPYGNNVSNEPGSRFAPRVGFSWDPFGHGMMALRGGYGIVFDSTLVGIFENNIFTNPTFLNNLNVSSTTFANPSGGNATTSLSAVRATPLPATLPYTQMWSLDLQQAFKGGVIVDVGYYGTTSTHLLGIVDRNTLPAGAAVAAGTMTAPLTTGTTAKAVNALRPYVGYIGVNSVENWFASNYNSLQASVEKRMSNSSLLRASYTWQKTMTDASSDRSNAPQDQYNIHADYSAANFNRNQVLVVSYVYNLPFFAEGSSFAHKALHGWEWVGTTSFDSGLATLVSSAAGKDWAGFGVLGSSSQVALRPDKISDPNSGAPHTLKQWFNTAAYTDVPAGQVRAGNAHATSLIGPGFQQWDTSLFRTIDMGKRFHLQLRAESFNVFNHTNPQTVNASGPTSDNAAFGKVTGVREPRRVQIGAKIIF
jgi:hypothetical protein